LQQLNNIWNKWLNSIKKVANQIIPKTYTVSKTYQAYFLKATKLHLALKLINKCLSNLRSNKPPLTISFILQNFNNLFQQISLYTEQIITPCQTQDLTLNFNNFQQTLKQLKKTLWKACRLEIQNAQSEKINFYIQ
jgi:hypothetical protein